MENKGTDDNVSNNPIVSMSINSIKRGHHVVGTHKASKGKKVVNKEISLRNSRSQKQREELTKLRMK